MATRLIPLYTRVTDYTQVEEDLFSATLSGKPFGWAVIYNTNLSVVRTWNGTVFETLSPVPPTLISLNKGSMFARNISQLVVINTIGVPVQISAGFTSGLCKSFVFQNNRELKCQVAGEYSVNWSLSVNANSSNLKIEGSVMINGVNSNIGSCASIVSPGGNNRPSSISGFGVYQLAVNDLISLSLTNHTNTNDVSVEYGSLVSFQT